VTVVDASVAVKWFFPEPGAEASRELLSSGEGLAGPALLRVEVTAAITRKVRLHEIQAAEAKRAIGLWFRAIADGVVALMPDEVDLPKAVELALQVRHPLQDCLYLALAERLGTFLVTADPKFAGRASAVYSKVHLVPAE
jgi:predicted nucleic acid-binding protein